MGNQHTRHTMAMTVKTGTRESEEKERANSSRSDSRGNHNTGKPITTTTTKTTITMSNTPKPILGQWLQRMAAQLAELRWRSQHEEFRMQPLIAAGCFACQFIPENIQGAMNSADRINAREDRCPWLWLEMKLSFCHACPSAPQFPLQLVCRSATGKRHVANGKLMTTHQAMRAIHCAERLHRAGAD